MKIDKAMIERACIAADEASGLDIGSYDSIPIRAALQSIILTPNDAMIEVVGNALYIYWNDVNEQAKAAYRKKIRAALELALREA